jgi:hypothetical protein
MLHGQWLALVCDEYLDILYRYGYNLCYDCIFIASIGE